MNKNVKALDGASVAYLNSKGLFNVRTKDAGAAGATAANNYIPGGLLTAITPDLVEVVTRQRTADKIIGDRKKLLDWEKNDAVIPMIERLGETTPYSDFASASAVSINPSYVYAGHYRFTANVQVGDLETAQLAETRIDAGSQKRAAALETLAIEFNNVGLFGKNSADSMYPIHGILNHPDLPAYKAASSTEASATFDTVYADIQGMIVDVLKASKGHADVTSKMYLAIPNDKAVWLGLLNTVGKSVREALTDNYPNIEFVLSPELIGVYTGNKSVLYLRVEAENVANVQSSAVIGFSEIALSSATAVYPHYTQQYISSGSCGAIVYRPYMFSRRYINAN